MFPASWANEMEAIDRKEQAQRLQEKGCFEEALSLMLASVAMRSRSHLLCLSLSELAELYLDMLKFSDAEAAARKMIEEAWRYDTSQQLRIAEELLQAIAEEKANGLEHGASVELGGLTQRRELNGKVGVLRGRLRDCGRYCVDVDGARYSVKRCRLRILEPATA